MGKFGIALKNLLLWWLIPLTLFLFASDLYEYYSSPSFPEEALRLNSQFYSSRFDIFINHHIIHHYFERQLKTIAYTSIAFFFGVLSLMSLLEKKFSRLWSILISNVIFIFVFFLTISIIKTRVFYDFFGLGLLLTVFVALIIHLIRSIIISSKYVFATKSK